MKTGILVLTALLSAAPTPAPPAQDVDVQVHFNNPSLRVLQNYTLRPDETAEQVVVIGGDATIEGHVEHDVVVVLGRAQLASTARIDGSFVVIGGSATVADGARVDRDVIAFGNLQAPASFAPSGQQVAINAFGLDERVRHTLPWLTRGLLFGRLIVPDLRWVWIAAGIFFLINLLFNVVLDAPVRSCAATLGRAPVSAFLVGLLALLLIGPLCFVLVVSIVGIAVVPFLLCALVIAALIGRVGFARWIGMSVLPESDPESRGQGLRSFVIGSALICAAYIVPILGAVVWSLAAVFGLGAATIAFYTAYRRENPRRPKTPAPPPAAVEPQSPQPPSTEPLVPPVAPTTTPGAQPADEIPLRAEGTPLSFPHATFFERLAAFALDLVLIAILAQVVRFDRLFGEWSPDGNLLLVALVYHIAFWTWKQTTVGGIVCQLRVIRIDGTPMRFAEAFVRGLSGIFSLLLAGAGFLWILRDPERQAWHDRIAGTFVINVPRNWPI